MDMDISMDVSSDISLDIPMDLSMHISKDTSTCHGFIAEIWMDMPMEKALDRSTGTFMMIPSICALGYIRADIHGYIFGDMSEHTH